MKLRCITEDSGSYHRTFAVYLRYTKKTENTKTYLSGDFVTRLRQLKPENNRPLRYLTVGCGTGVKDIFILQQLRVLYPSHAIEVTAVEPAAEQLREFQKLASLEEFNGQVSFTWRQETGEIFRSLPTSSEYDIISCMECLYYEPDLNASLTSYNNLLSPKGIIVISIGNTECGWNKMQNAFREYLPMNTPCGSDEIREIIRSLGYPFEEVVLPNNFPIDSVFDKDSREGTDLLDFISHTVHFREEVPEDVQQRFLDKLKSEEICNLVDGSYLFDMSFVIFVVHKAQN